MYGYVWLHMYSYVWICLATFEYVYTVSMVIYVRMHDYASMHCNAMHTLTGIINKNQFESPI